MDCVSPTIVGKHAFPCGRCMSCRLNKREEWVTRILLEAGCHDQNAFVTLTYDPELFYAPGGDPKSVSARDFTLWIKRLRKLLSVVDGASSFRYYGCAEYGDKSKRPHYHALLFGYAPCDGRARKLNEGCACPQCDAVRSTWRYGHVLVGSVTEASARYLSKYVVKRQTLPCWQLEGRNPEFFRVSRAPGLGAGAIASVARALEPHLKHLPSDWVPRLLRVNGRKRPIGRYLRSLLAKELGREIPPLEEDSELRMVREYAWDNVLSVSEVYQKLRGQERSYQEKGSL